MLTKVGLVSAELFDSSQSDYAGVFSFSLSHILLSLGDFLTQPVAEGYKWMCLVVVAPLGTAIALL